MKTSVIAQKKYLRKELLNKAHNLPEDYKALADDTIIQTLLSLTEYKQADTIFCFVGVSHEINTRPFLQQVLDDGKRLCVPLCVSKGIMEARQIYSLNELVQGYYGLFEPTPDTQQIPMEEIGFAIIPCLSTDLKGNRLGHGGGYYDRLFNQYPDIPAVIICRECMTQENLPIEPFDHPFHLTVTEDGIYRH